MVSYAHALRAQYHSSFWNALINDIVDDMISSDFLKSAIRSMYVSYIRVTMLVLKHSIVHSLPKELKKEGAGTKRLGIASINYAKINSSDEVDVKMTPQAAAVFVHNPARPSSFHSVSLYKRAPLFRQALEKAHYWHAACFAISFAEFLEVNVLIPISRSISINAQLFNTKSGLYRNPLDSANS